MNWRPQNSLSEEEAQRRLIQGGVVPLEPYPGKLGLPWKSRCLTCWGVIYPRLASINPEYKACALCRGLPTDSTALEVSLEISRCFELLSEYKGISSPITVRCLTCGYISAALLRDIRAGRGCSSCRSKKLNEIHNDEALEIDLENAAGHDGSFVYRLQNCANRRFYIGSTGNLRSRWKSHLRDLEEERHVNSALQVDYQRFGRSSFKFSVSRRCQSRFEAFAHEHRYLNVYWGRFRCYNMHPWADGAESGNVVHARNHILGMYGFFITSHAAARELFLRRSDVDEALLNRDVDVDGWQFTIRRPWETDAEYCNRTGISLNMLSDAYYSRRGLTNVGDVPGHPVRFVPSFYGFPKRI